MRRATTSLALVLAYGTITLLAATALGGGGSTVYLPVVHRDYVAPGT